MEDPLRILVFGASYGSLFGVKCAAAGHSADLVCLAAEAEAINRDGATIVMPVRDRGRVEVNSKSLRGRLSAGDASAFRPAEYDLVVLAMQEPQYRSRDVRALLDAAAQARIPCLSLMNLAPPPYLRRIPTIDVAAVAGCYTDASAWDAFDPALVTLASPDAQAVRLPGEPPNRLHLRLATNFRAARFEDDAHTGLLRRLERDIQAVRFDSGDGAIELPVKLRVHDSLYVPLGKWCMMLAGNYRCVQAGGMRSIRDAVHADAGASREIYEWVAALCRSLGADEADLVPFEKYANAALSLQSPSSAARALAGGACWIERADRMIQAVAAQHGMHSKAVDDVVACVDGWLAGNRLAA